MNFWEYCDNHTGVVILAISLLSLAILIVVGGVESVLVAWANRNRPICPCCAQENEGFAGDEGV
jgi:hypothetical protein